LTVFRQEFGKVILLVGLFLLPELLGSLVLDRMMRSGIRIIEIYRYWVLGAMVLQMLAQAPAVQVTYARLTGRPVRAVDALGRSRGRYASALGIGVAEHLVTLIGIVFFGFYSLILNIVWFLMMAAFWYVALSAVLIENRGVLAGLKRSASLTKGYRWRVFGLVLVAAIAPGLGIYFLDMALFQILGRDILIVVDFPLRVLVISAQTIIGTVTYHSLRTAKEGHAVERLSEVFA